MARIFKARKEKGKGRDEDSGKTWLRRNYRFGLMLIGIFVVALLVRSYFAYDAIYTDYPPNVAGNDPYYHKRAVDHITTTHHTLLSDPMLNYPLGGGNCNPPLFEWGAALTGYLFSPVFGGVTEATWYAYPMYPIFWSAMCVIPVYLISVAMFNRKVGLLASLFVALAPAHIERISLGFTDHDSFTQFFILTTFFFFLMALKHSKSEYWVRKWSNVKDVIVGAERFRSENRIAIGYSIMAGISLAAVALAWKGVSYVYTIIFIYLIFELIVNKIRKIDSTTVTLLTFITIFLSFILIIPYYYTTTRISYLDGPIVFFLAMAIFAVVFVPTRDRPWLIVIPSFFGIIAIGMGVLYLVFPDLWYTLSTGMGYFVKSKLVSTIAEAQPGDFSRLSFSFGVLNYFMGLIGFGFLAYRFSKDLKTHAIFLLIWSVIMLYMALSTVRFMFDATPIFAILSAWMIYFIIEKLDPNWRFLYIGGAILVVVLFGWTYAIMDLGDYDIFLYILSGGFAAVALAYVGIFAYEYRVLNRKDQKLRNLLGALFLAFFLILPNVWFAVDAGIPYAQKEELDPEGKLLGTYGSSLPSDYWVDCFDWLSRQDTDEAPEDKPAFISWWDYGFWCVYMSEHPTVADNFQWGYQLAGSYLLSQNESESITLFIIRTIENKYREEDIENLLLDGYLTQEEYDELVDIFSIESAGEDEQKDLIKEVDDSPEKYGKYKDLKIKNAKYAAARHFFISRFDLEDLVNIYQGIEEETGKKIRYFAVDYRLFPFSAQNTGIFYAPVKLADRDVGYYLEYLAHAEINYGTTDNPEWQPVGHPLTEEEVKDYSERYEGFFRITGYELRYKKEFFNTMLYKCYIGYGGGDIGMFDDEGHYEQGIPGLDDNNPQTTVDTLPPMQGRGLKHYRLVYKTTYWNPHNESELSEGSDYYKEEYGDEWVPLGYEEAMDKKNKEGGVITSGLRSGVSMLKYYHGAVMEGQVITDNGRPVGGARVTVNDEYGIPHDSVITDKEGRYSLILPFGQSNIFVSKGGYESGETGIYQKLQMVEKTRLNATQIEITDEQAMRKEGTKWRIDRDIEVDSSKLSGRIYWDDNGDGEYNEGEYLVPGAEIKLINQDYSENLTYVSTSDENGSYSMDDIVAGQYSLQSYVKGHLVESTGGAVTIEPGKDMEDEDIAIDGATLAVHIKSPADRNISGIKVDFRDTTGGIKYSNVSDDNGTARFDKIVTGKYVIEINETRYLNKKIEKKIEEGEDYDTNVTLVPALNLRGKVWSDIDKSKTYSGDFERRVNGRVSYLCRETNNSYITFSNETGEYSLKVPIGSYDENRFYSYEVNTYWDSEDEKYVSMEALDVRELLGFNVNKSYKDAYEETSAFTESEVRNLLDQSRNLQIERAGRVNGTVYDERGQSLIGMNVRFTPVSVLDNQPGSRKAAWTDVPINKEGKYICNLAQGEYHIYVYPPEMGPGMGIELDTILVDGNKEVDFVIRNYTRVSGRTYWDKDGNGRYTTAVLSGNDTVNEGVGHITVLFSSDKGSVLVDSDREGSYGLYLPLDTYNVMAYDGYADRYVSDEIEITLDEQGDKVLNVSLEPVPVTASIRVWNDWNNDGVGNEGEEGEDGLKVIFLPTGMGREKIEVSVKDGTAKADLIPGTYLINLDHNATGNAYSYHASKKIDIPFGEEGMEGELVTEVSIPMKFELAGGQGIADALKNLTIINNEGEEESEEGNTTEGEGNTLLLEMAGWKTIRPHIELDGRNITFTSPPGEYSIYASLINKEDGMFYASLWKEDVNSKVEEDLELHKARHFRGGIDYYEKGAKLTYHGPGGNITLEREDGAVHIMEFDGWNFDTYLPPSEYDITLNFTSEDGKYLYDISPNSSHISIEEGQGTLVRDIIVNKWRKVTGKVEFKEEGVEEVDLTFTSVRDPTLTYHARTNETGAYSILMRTGVYNISISKYGYLSNPKSPGSFDLSRSRESFDITMNGDLVTFKGKLIKGEEVEGVPTKMRVSLRPVIGGELETGQSVDFFAESGRFSHAIEPGKYVIYATYQVNTKYYGILEIIDIPIGKDLDKTIEIKPASKTMFIVTYRDFEDKVHSSNVHGTLDISMGPDKVMGLRYEDGTVSGVLPYNNYTLETEFSTVEMGMDVSYSYKKTHTVNQSNQGVVLQLGRDKVYDVEIIYDQPPEFSVNSDETLEFSIIIKNLGNTEDTVKMSTLEKPDSIQDYEWKVEFEKEDYDVGVLDTAEVNVTLEVPSKIRPESALVIQAESADGGSSAKDSIEFTIRTVKIVDFTIEPIGLIDRGVQLDHGVSYEIFLQNGGNTESEYNLTLQNLPDDWNHSASVSNNNVRLDGYGHTIGPYENATVVIELMAPNGTSVENKVVNPVLNIRGPESTKNVGLKARIDVPDVRVTTIARQNTNLKDGDIFTVVPIIKCDHVAHSGPIKVLLFIDNEKMANKTIEGMNETEETSVRFEINASDKNLDGDYHTIEVVLEIEGNDKIQSNNNLAEEWFIGAEPKKEEQEINWNLIGFLVVILVIAGIGIYWWRKREIV